MKTLLIVCLSLLVSQMTHAHRYLGCGVGVYQPHWHGLNDRLQHGTERYGMVHCQFEHQPLPDRRQWLFALPAVQWQRAQPTELSRSGWDASHQAINIQLPLYRHSGNSAYWQGIWHEQHTEFGDQLQAGQILRSGIAPNSNAQAVLVRQRQRDLGIAVDVSHWQVPVNQLQLRYRQIQQPVAYQWNTANDSQDWFGNSERTLWLLQIGHQAEGVGWRWPWHIGLGHGQHEVNQRPATSSSRDARMSHQQITVQIAADYRHRFTRRWHGRVQGIVQGEYGLYESVPLGAQMRNEFSMDYTLLASLEWRR